MLRNLSDAGDGQIPMIKAFNVNNRTIYGNIYFFNFIITHNCMDKNRPLTLLGTSQWAFKGEFDAYAISTKISCVGQYVYSNPSYKHLCTLVVQAFTLDMGVQQSTGKLYRIS